MVHVQALKGYSTALASGPAGSEANEVFIGCSLTILCCEVLCGYPTEAGCGFRCSQSPSQTLATALAGGHNVESSRCGKGMFYPYYVGVRVCLSRKIHFNKYRLSPYFLPGTGLGSRDSDIKRHRPCLPRTPSLIAQRGTQDDYRHRNHGRVQGPEEGTTQRLWPLSWALMKRRDKDTAAETNSSTEALVGGTCRDSSCYGLDEHKGQGWGAAEDVVRHRQGLGRGSLVCCAKELQLIPEAVRSMTSPQGQHRRLCRHLPSARGVEP